MTLKPFIAVCRRLQQSEAGALRRARIFRPPRRAGLSLRAATSMSSCSRREIWCGSRSPSM